MKIKVEVKIPYEISGLTNDIEKNDKTIIGMNEKSTLADLLNRLGLGNEKLKIVVNGKIKALDSQLNNGDIVCIFPL